eukprot:COSAG06_NODE_32093_length_511_cov_1.072816_1_plen_79_part_00
MPGGAISCTQGLPNNIVQMFEARPPLDPPLLVDKPKMPQYTGVGSYVPHFLPSEQVSDGCGGSARRSRGVRRCAGGAG